MSTKAVDEPLDALTQQFRQLHYQVTACFELLHATRSAAEKAELAEKIQGLLALEMQLWSEAKEYMRRELRA